MEFKILLLARQIILNSVKLKTQVRLDPLIVEALIQINKFKTVI